MTPVQGMPQAVLVCEGSQNVIAGQSLYTPDDPGRVDCPRDWYVRDSRSGSPYAQWDYSAGENKYGAPQGPLTDWISWGGILRAWEVNGKWTGGVAPLLTVWPIIPGYKFRVQVFFYCEPGQPWGTRTRGLFASPFTRSAETPLLEREDGSPPPADAGSAPESGPGVEAPPPAPEPTVKRLRAGHHRLRGGRGRKRLIDSGTGTDTLIGGTGRQTLIAGFGNDTLHAGRGDQTLIGGRGRDTLIGGTGRDGLFTAGPRNRIIAGKGPSMIAALGRGDTVDCRNHRATVVAIRGAKVRRCRNVRRVRQPAWARKPPWVNPRSKH